MRFKCCTSCLAWALFVCAGCNAGSAEVGAAKPARTSQRSSQTAVAGVGGVGSPPALVSENPATLVTPQGQTAAGGGAREPGDLCKSTNATAEPVPVDVFVMIDQSLSMVAPDDSGQTRWDSVIGALTEFVQAPGNAGLGIGLQYFGLGLAGSSCEPTDYATAEVEIAPLPDNAPSIIASLSQHGPSSVTPTAPALEGAITHARAYGQMHPTHTVAVLLVTDGEPDLCGVDLLGDTVNAARAGTMGSPPVATYVLGVGTSLDALNQIAQGGGTDHAYIVDGMQNVSAQVVEALNKIRGMAALPCVFVIPPPDPGMSFDFDKVNLTYTPPGGTDVVVGYAADETVCNTAQMSWRYDDPSSPTKILLCDQTCKAVTEKGGAIAVALHCPTVVLN